MAKLMLVEDDNNLREIYEARLQAEGYTIVSAMDGEEALVLAKAEKPDLIISDVMMPKISGFEMLDILRNTEDLKDVKIIMLTALGQADDQERADRLGADRYLVKSQVTLEDIVKAAHELLDDQGAPPVEADPVPGPAPSSDPTAPLPTVTPVKASVPEPASTIPMATESPATDTVQADPASTAQSTAKEAGTVEAQIEDFVAGATQEPSVPAGTPQAEPSDASTTVTAEPPKPEEPKEPVAVTQISKPQIPVSPPPTIQPQPTVTGPKTPNENISNVPIAKKKVISPIESDPKKDISTLLALEEAKQAIAQGPPPPTVVIATDETGATSVPFGEPESTSEQSSVNTIIPTVEPPASAATIKSINGDKIDPNSIAL